MLPPLPYLPCSLQGVLLPKEGYLILRGASRLDAFSVYPFQTWLLCHAVGRQQIHQWSVHPGPLVLRTAPLKYPPPAPDRDRTVSRRSEPSSRGLALAELIAGVNKPSATLVLGGGHSIGIPLAVSARRSFIVPTATMTVHPVRHSGMVLGVPQTLRYFEQMQERIVGFVASHSKITARRFTALMHNTGELVMDMGTVLDGRQAVEEGLIDELGGLGDALRYLYKEIESGR